MLTGTRKWIGAKIESKSREKKTQTSF